MFQQWMRALGLGAAVLAAASCGGGGGGGGSAPPGNPPVTPPAASPLVTKGLVCSGADGSGWCWQAPRPAGDGVNDVFFLDAKLGWVGGNNGYVAKTTDGGASWTRLPPAPTLLTHLAFADALHGWALNGSTTTVLRTVDGGQSWQVQTVNLPAVDISGARGLRVLDANRVMLTGLTSCSFRLFAICTEYILGSSDGGTSWRSVANGNDVTVAPSGSVWSTDLQIATPAVDPDPVRRTGDLGATSAALGTLPPCNPRLDVVNEQTVWGYCGGYQSRGPFVDTSTLYVTPTVYKSGDGGLSFTDMQASFPLVANRRWALDGVVLTAQGDGWGLLTDMSSGVAGPVTTLRASNGGKTWTTLAQLLPAALAGAVGFADTILDANSLWLVLNNQVQWTEDGGANWQQLPLPPAETLTPAHLRRDDGAGLVATFIDIAVGGVQTDTTRFYRSLDKGKTWLRVPGGIGLGDHANAVVGLWMFADGKGLALRNNGNLLDTADFGLTWLPRVGNLPDTTQPCCDTTGRLQFSTNGNGWFIKQGQLQQSSDRGASWRVASVPAGMAKLVDLQVQTDQRLWAVTEAGQLFASTDGGANWASRPVPAGWQARLVQFHDDKTGLLLVYDGSFYEGIWRTTDGGQTWVVTSFNGRAGTGVRRIRFSDAYNAWLVSARYEHMLHSSDGGALWSTVAGVPSESDNNYGVALNDIQFVGNTAWVVGTNGLVLASSNGGQSWQAQASLGAGLATVFFLDANTGWAGGGPGAILATASGGR